MKNQLLKLIGIALILALPVISFAHIPNALMKNQAEGLAPMLQNVTPAIVNVAVEKEVPGDNTVESENNPANRQQVAVASGVIFNAEKGFIVTNAHVIDDQKFIFVTLKSGRRYRAKLIGKDTGFDIAIIQIKAPKLTAIPFADSDQLQVGNFVAAIGNPFGLTQTVTSGVISALNRSEPRIEGFQSFIQTDAPINPGNSGGALINLQGQLIGINTAIVSPSYGNSGIGFSIPSNMVKSVIDQLIQYGKVERGMLGVIAQDITPELADALNLKPDEGTIVTQIVPGSAAEKAGVHVQDVIQSLDDKIIHSSAQLRNTLGLMRPGTKIKLQLIRDHNPLTITASVGDPNANVSLRQQPFIAGLRLRDIDELEGDGSHLTGVLVVGVNDDSPGLLAGLMAGDVITQVNDKKITHLDQLEKMALAESKQLLLKISRGQNSLFLVVEPQ